MGGLFSRVKIWGTTDTLTAADLNAEFDNVINNFIPQEMAGYSATVGQMQTQTNPGSVGTESLATSLSGEIERLRFMLNAIIGQTYWYQTPGASIAQLVSALGTASLANKISSGATNGVTGSSQPMFLIPDGSTNRVKLAATTTPFVYSIAATTYTISADTTLTSLTTAPASNNTCVVNDTSVDNSARTKLLGENGSSITVATMGTSVSSLIGQLAAFKTANGTAEYIIARVESSTLLTQVSRGYFFNSSSAIMSRQTINNGDTLTLMKLTWIFVTTLGALAPVYTNPRVSGTAPSSPATGDYWFDTVVNYWKSYSGTTWLQANATLIGVCIQDTTKTVGARSFDFFSAYSATNSVELFLESATEVRSRYTGGQVNVYGSTFNFTPDFIRWDTPANLDTGVTISANTFYYLYLNTQGNTLISDVSPYDRRADLLGYYHPANTYRCLGMVHTDAGSNFSEIESFYVSDLTTSVSTLTAAVTNLPLPYSVSVKENFILLDSTGGVFTQVIPPPYQWKGRTLSFMKKSSDLNLITLQAWGNSALTTTGTIASFGATTITAMGSTTGLTAGQLVTGPGILPGTLLTAVSAATATIGTAAMRKATAQNYNFASSTGINGLFTTTLAVQFESVTLFSDGTSIYIISSVRNSPGWINAGPTTFTGTTTNPTKGTTSQDTFEWRKNGPNADWRMNFVQTGAGTNGSGDYLFAFPAGLPIDTTQVPAYTTVLGTGNAVGMASYIGTFMCINTITATGACYVYDTSHFRMSGVGNNSGTAALLTVGSGSEFPMTTTACALAASGSVPILGWSG